MNGASSAQAAIPPRLRLLQALDRQVGGALVRTVRPRATGTPGEPLTDLRRVLVIRPGGLGDALLLWPLLDALRAAWPGASVDVLAERRNAGAFALNPEHAGALRVFHYDDAPLQTWRALRQQPYDLVIDTEQYHHLSIVLANALRPRWLCGFRTLGRGRLLTHAADHDEETYEARAFLRLGAALLGRELPFAPDRPFLSVGAAAADFARSALPARLSRVVALLPGAGGPYRRWAPARYGDVGAALAEQGCHLLLLGGSDALAAGRQIAALLRPGQVTNLIGRTSLAQTAALLQRCALAVSADTGVLHLAYGVGTPTVGLFGSGLFRKWAPVGQAHRLVRVGLPCSPCTRHGRVPPCPYHVACMTELRPAAVLAATAELLA